jgi:succinate dehydrogenase/fumarate reductase flavoprotein subunit
MKGDNMSIWVEHIQSDGSVPEWPYPITYKKVNEIDTDVLVLGGGIAGCHAAIHAARKGSKVVVVEKGATKRSGRGGAGVDHWLAACTNPCSKVDPEDYAREMLANVNGYGNGPLRYILAKESWEALLDMEQMGMQIRDVEGEFEGADFRDHETKLMFAYDYENRLHIRVWGYNVKPSLYKELKRLDVKICDRVMATSLLNDEGKQGGRVVGATGLNVRTGEFYVFRAKATIVSANNPQRQWVFAPEYTSSANMTCLNNAGVGHAIGWKAGAEFCLMEKSVPMFTGMGYIPYGMGNANNTYHGASIVDADGKKVPYFDTAGRELKTVQERFLPGPGKKFLPGSGTGADNPLRPGYNDIAKDLPNRIRQGEYRLPLYMDLTRLPEHERHVIFGMMVGNEGKTRIPVYDIYTKAGFDPDKDLLQVPVMPPDAYGRSTTYWLGLMLPHLMRLNSGGYWVDWKMKTSLEGLYAAGESVFGHGSHASAAVTGGYAGRQAAKYASNAAEPVLNSKQVEAEKLRVYAPLKKKNGYIGWKELNAGIVRVMQDYCGKFRSEETLNIGLDLLKGLQESEATKAYAANPHELGRLLECYAMLTVGEMIMNASKMRKASNLTLNFNRIDNPNTDEPRRQKQLPIRLEKEDVKVREVPLDYHLKSPYSSSYEDNYMQNRVER